MELSELIVIYLACGAPFAVHYATSRRPERAFTKFVNMALALVAWPVFATRTIVEQFRYRALAGDRRIESLRAQLEITIFPSDRMQSVFEFRETFYRYVGLARALNERSPEGFGNDLFEIVSHPNEVLAARCIARKNRSRLERHRDAARSDFLATIAGLSAGGHDRENVFDMAATLSEQIGDHTNDGAYRSANPLKKPATMESSPERSFEAAR